MAKAYKNKQEQESPTPRLPNASEYYYDRYSEQDEGFFTIEKVAWRNIKQNNSSDKTLTDKELEYISLINGFLKNSPEGVEYFSKEYLCERLNICERQLRRIRTNTSHVFMTKWRKKTKTYRGSLEKVYAIRPTEHTVFLLKETKYYKSVKLGHQCPSSIYKDEKYIKEDRSSKSTFCKNSNSSQAKFYGFKQYDKPKTLGDHYPLTAEDCSELQSRSGRDFTLNAMNEILLDMSRKPKLQGHRFVSKTQFMAYMSKVYRYEGRDAVKTANSGFKILARATEAEVIAHTTQDEREKYLKMVEDKAITHRSDENQYRAKLAGGGSLKPSQAYNFLSNLRTVCKVGDIFEVHMSQHVSLTDHSLKQILSEANAVGGYNGVEKLEFIVKQKEVTKQAKTLIGRA